MMGQQPSLISIVKNYNCPKESGKSLSTIIVDRPFTYQKIDRNQQNLQRQENRAHWSADRLCHGVCLSSNPSNWHSMWISRMDSMKLGEGIQLLAKLNARKERRSSLSTHDD